MLDLCTKEGLPEPKFEEQFGGLEVTFKFANTITPEINKKQKIQHVELSQRQKIILNFIRKAEDASTQQVLDHLKSKFSKVPSHSTILRELNDLKAQGYLKLKGEKRGATWVLQSDTTD